MDIIGKMIALSVLLGTLCLTPDSTWAGTVVADRGIARGQVIIRTSQRVLLFGIGGGKAIRYQVAVGRKDRQWTGHRRIQSKRIKPDWTPTAEILRDKPRIQRRIPGGSPKNPMGAAALILSGPGQYAIHGTNSPKLIGQAVSYGCIRMRNADISDLFARVQIGTTVTVTR